MALGAIRQLGEPWATRLSTEADVHLWKQLRAGPLFYLALLLAFTLWSEVGRRAPAAAWLLVGASALVALLRFVVVRPPGKTALPRSRWRVLFAASVLLNVAIPPLYFALSIRATGLGSATFQFGTFLAVAAVGNAYVCAPWLLLARLSAVVLILLPAALTLFAPGPDRGMSVVLLLAAFAYALVVSQQLHRHYWEGALAHARLEIGRDELARSEQRFLRLIEGNPDAIGLVRGGQVLFANRAWRDVLGRLGGENGVESVVHVSDAAALRALTTAPQAPGESTRLRLVGPAGAQLQWEVASSEIEYDGAPALLLAARDVTEQVQMRQQLARSERLVTVGTLAAGMAHEINNPLTYVRGNIDFALSRFEESPVDLEIVEGLREAHEGVIRVSRIVRDLLIFSRVRQDGLGPVDLHEVVDFALRIAANHVKHRAELVRNRPEGPLLVLASQGRLGQVVLNLLMNAVDAIPEDDRAEHRIVVTTRRGGDGRVMLEVADTGRGIAPEDLPRIFDPFFTTKAPGDGMGLGLSICHANVQSFDGELLVESEVGRGSTFTVLLQPAEESAVPEALTEQRGGSM